MSTQTLPALESPYPGAWPQPPLESILIDETHALMSRATFESLAEYSTTMPTGVYPGKLWRRHDGAYDRNCAPAARRWLLCWYGPVRDGKCPIEFREVLIA
jgi:hypothetical protein